EAQLILDAAQADARDLWEPDMAPAAVHLETCRNCQSVLQKKNRFDLAFGVAVRDVTVPSGLKQRMLAAIAVDSSCGSSSLLSDIQQVGTDEEMTVAAPTEETTLSGVAATATLENRPRRQRLWWISTAAVALIVALSSFWFWPTEDHSGSLDELLAGFAVHGQYQTPFDENFSVKLPAEGWDAKPLQIEGPFGFASAHSSHDLAAVYRFRLAARHRPLQGKLIAIPISRIANPPSPSTIFEVAAESSSDGSYSHAAWTEGEFVFVCYVDGHAGNFTALQQALAPRLG
ncbi:MAG: hypothetical protein O3A29_21590, partial [Planctomycetota bacterium]|nr:hypothetical protein [Planctomycetota bacterium]